jgi:transcriptional regulator with XRE-family HTH domain
VLDALELITRRTQEKLSQADFARMLGISQNYLSELESGHKQVGKALETKYNQLYPKRLVSITFSRGVECPKCRESHLEPLNDPDDELDKIYRCKDCSHIFTVGQAWGLHYRP